MDEVEAGALRSSARAALASASPVLPLAAVDPRAVDGLATELGWTDLGGDLRALVIVAEELGRAGSDWPVHETFADGDDVLHALALVARAIGAARAGHELAVQHAIDRVQFGQPIGAFQAVSHRLADAAVELAGWDAVVGSIDAGDPVALLAAVVHGRAAALRALGAAQRTLGAMGYFDEHALPWLFRR
ncbi:MAG: hypothetical protein M3Z03_01485, partial [Actinomycetota bacterium]|nr:hypothetical protein [Actinomycetota bacterium]